MESLKYFTIFFICSFLSSAYSAIVYYDGFMGHLHKSASNSSASLTTIQCAQPLKILNDENKSSSNWMYVEVGEDKGFVHQDFISQERPTCFQEKYPRFYQGQNLDITDLYFWGRLNDHYLRGESRAP